MENAIEHGLRNKIGSKDIYLTVINNQGRLVISLRDNGCGMDDRQLAILNSTDEATILESNNSIGISNVKERIMLTFKGNGSVIIKSTQGEGTEIIIDIPCIQEDKSFA